MHSKLVSSVVDATTTQPHPKGRAARSRIRPLFVALTIALTIGILAFAAGHAQAQTPASASTAAAQPSYGTPIAGLCVFSRDAAIDNSVAGLAATKRMQELTTRVNTDLQPERDAIAKEQTMLADPKNGLSAAVLKTRRDALAIRTTTFGQSVQTRNAQLVQTRQDVLAKLTTGLRPALVASITAGKCSAVFERSNIYGFNPKMDITDDVTTRLNASVQPFSFDLSANQTATH